MKRVEMFSHLQQYRRDVSVTDGLRYDVPDSVPTFLQCLNLELGGFRCQIFIFFISRIQHITSRCVSLLVCSFLVLGLGASIQPS